MKEETSYNKFQYSEFVGEKGQLVFRADTWDELLGMLMDAGITLPTLGAGIPKPPAIPQAEEPPHPAVQPINFPTVCMTCKQPATQRSGVSKTGKPYNGIFCTVNKNHVTWL